jgi:DNA (cytosine-5)-methyltransferase 1
MTLRYLSVCSGIEAATVAWEPLGFTAAGFAEIEAFPSAVLAHHYGSNMPGEPLSKNGVPNFGDFTAIDLDQLGRVDLLVGGTPCQAFSVAGQRLSLADARGNLTLAYAVLAHELARSHGLRNCVWENVPGVLNTPDNAFGCFLGALVGGDAPLRAPGDGGWPRAGMASGPRARLAWIVRDAQYFGVAQRRERVFVVADFGGGAIPQRFYLSPRACAGILRRAEKRGKTLPDMLRRALESVAHSGGGRTSGPIDKAACLTANGGGQAHDFEVETFLVETAHAFDARQSDVIQYGDISGPLDTDGYTIGIAHTLRGEGFDASEDGTGRGTPIVPVAFDTTQITSATNRCNPHPGDPCRPLAAGAHPPAIAEPFTIMERGRGGERNLEYRNDGTANALLTPNGGRGGLGVGAIATQWAVRRLTPAECARLQGFPDHHARIPWRGKPAELCPDGPQYKAYGNSMAVPVMRWIGERIAAAMPDSRKTAA